jgi:hypothetical protein
LEEALAAANVARQADENAFGLLRDNGDCLKFEGESLKEK